jgi:hypothetical protein
MNRVQIINELMFYKKKWENNDTSQHRKYLEMFETEDLGMKLQMAKAWAVFRERAIDLKDGNYYEVGQVIKIDADAFYNYWAVILRIDVKKRELEIMVENRDYSIITLPITNVKASIGTIDLDLYELENRHQTEVVPLIKKAQKKYPQYFNN